MLLLRVVGGACGRSTKAWSGAVEQRSVPSRPTFWPSLAASGRTFSQSPLCVLYRRVGTEDEAGCVCVCVCCGVGRVACGSFRTAHAPSESSRQAALRHFQCGRRSFCTRQSVGKGTMRVAVMMRSRLLCGSLWCRRQSAVATAGRCAVLRLLLL